MDEKGRKKDIYQHKNNVEEDRNAPDLLINIPPDEENGIEEITYEMDGMIINPSSAKNNIDNPNQFISQSLLQKLEANTPMTSKVINIQQDYLKINLKEDLESDTPQMVASTPIGSDTIQEKRDIIAKMIQNQGSQSPNAIKSDLYLDKSKSQQFKYNSNRQPNNASPIYSYFNTSQKILSEHFYQNEDARERVNFMKKQTYDKISLGSNIEQKNEGSNPNNPLMNMNFNFFNQNVNNLLNSPNKSNSPLIHQQDNKRDNTNKDQKYIDLKTNYDLMQNQYYNQESDEDEESPQYTPLNMNKQSNNKGLLNYPETSPNYNANINKQFPFPDDFNQEFLMTQKYNNEDYIFEKFGKRGWECEKCSNFNFETRVKCNRCEASMQPKLLSKIRREGLEKNDEKKKKPLKERQGDWSCPKCRNLNFAFRQICNRCQLPKTEAELMLTGMSPLFPNIGLPSYPPNLPNHGFNYIDSQNMINGNINIFNYYNMHNKGMLYQNMNMMKYMNDSTGNIHIPQFQLEQQQQQQQLQSKKSKNNQIGKQAFNQSKKTQSNTMSQSSFDNNHY